MTSFGVTGRRFRRSIGAGLTAAVVMLVAACGSEAATPAGTPTSSATTGTVTAPPLTSESAIAATTSTATTAVPVPTESESETVAESESETETETETVVTTPGTPISEPSVPSPSPATTTATPTPTTPASPAGAGRVVVIDPGHNGANGANPSIINAQVDAGFGETKACNTTGTSTNDDYPEHAFTWAVAQRVTALLEADGVTVVLTRESDDGVGPCVDDRAAIGNGAGAAAVVSIHGDGSAAGDRGFYAMTSERLPNGAGVGAQSLALATAVRDGLIGAGAAPSNYVGSDGLWKRDDLAGLNLSRVPTTMLELGNMRDADDAAYMKSDAGQDALAAGIAQGILEWLAAN